MSEFHGAGHRKIRKKYIAAGQAGATIRCWICTDPIDMSLPMEDHYAFQLEDIKPLSLFPWLANDPANKAASHRICNVKKGQGTPKPGITHTSRDWNKVSKPDK